MLIGPRHILFRLRSLNRFAAALLTVPTISLAAQTLEIKLVDARNGRPMVGTSAYVNIWVGRERKEAIAIPTDESGVARLKLTLDPNEVNIPISTGHGTIVEKHPVVQYDESFRINVPFVVCWLGEGERSPLGLKNFSTKEVLDHGYVSENTCGKVTVTPQPSQIVLFVRRPTFIEKMKQ